MIFAFSTSSRLASLAVLDAGGEVLWAGAQEAPQAASSACMVLLERAQAEKGLSVSSGELFLADLGPGSFTGVRVGIVLAKSFGFLYGKPCAGASAFDLITLEQTVVLPLKRGEYFIRLPGEAPFESKSLPSGLWVGYGPPDISPVYPEAVRFSPLLNGLTPAPAEDLVPSYLIEPSISIPKRPMSGVTS